MSGLLYLGAEDFTIAKGIKGPVLCTSIRGFSLILFYSEKCVHSRKLLPIFKKLPANVGSCQFGMINIERNMLCIEMSKRTISPVTYVPTIILYVAGRPYMSYKGPHELEEIKRFIFDVSQSISKKKSKVTPSAPGATVKENPKAGGLHEYCLGVPLYGDDNVTYLEFDASSGYKTHDPNKPQTSGYADASKVVYG